MLRAVFGLRLKRNSLTMSTILCGRTLIVGVVISYFQTASPLLIIILKLVIQLWFIISVNLMKDYCRSNQNDGPQRRQNLVLSLLKSMERLPWRRHAQEQKTGHQTEMARLARMDHKQKHLHLIPAHQKNNHHKMRRARMRLRRLLWTKSNQE